MRFIIIGCLLAFAFAAPRPQDVALEQVEQAEEEAAAPVVLDIPDDPIPVLAPAPVQRTSPLRNEPSESAAILRDDREDQGDGNFNYAFETDNGISVSVVGTPGAAGQSNMEGVFSFLLDDGTIAEVRFVANENGFQPQSDLLPTAHPLPAHALEQIRFAEEQRALGIEFE